ncbi:hypothetical protein J6TS1_44440 [Siminovitchia terrae]|uniref:Photosystem II protein L n=1 Tax=Siminovitchia terrae TaxID=1914933 RepID=A0ABQ4L3W4_SIMTE|nr:hypothetical protein [Siminovitchia terrae]GIN98574.1 hypothetical protein J6TS1_44440 [Siminovitchia terrae]
MGKQIDRAENHLIVRSTYFSCGISFYRAIFQFIVRNFLLSCDLSDYRAKLPFFVQTASIDFQNQSNKKQPRDLITRGCFYLL